MFIKALILTIAISAQAEVTRIINPGEMKTSVAVAITSKIIYDTRSGSPDLAFSNINAFVGDDSNMRVLLNRFFQREPLAMKYCDFIYGFSVKLSLMPTVMKSSVREDLRDKLDETLASKSEALKAQSTLSVDAALAADPNYQGLPQVAKDQVRRQVLQTTFEQVEAGIEKARHDNRKKIEHRLNDVQLELTFQEVAVGFGKVFGNGKALLVAQVGKYRPESGPALDGNGQSEVDNLRARKDTTQALAATAPTGTVGLTSIQMLTKDLIVRQDFFLFHDRPPFLSARDHIGEIVTKEDKDYDQYKKFYQIDSGLFRVLFQFKNIQAYVSAGQYDGKWAGGAGGKIDVTDNDSIHLDFAKGEREKIEQALRILVNHEFHLAVHSSVNAFGGYEQVWKNKDATVSLDKKQSYKQGFIGVQFVIYEGEISVLQRFITRPVNFHLSVSAEGNYRDCDSLCKDGVGAEAGALGGLRW